MNSSKILFVGRYAKSPKKSPKKTNRSSKSKYEDISLGTVMRTSKSRNKDANNKFLTKKNTSRNDYEKRSTLESIRKINLNDKVSNTTKSSSVNKRYTDNNSKKVINNYKNKENSLQFKNKNSVINVKKIAEEQSVSINKKRPSISKTKNVSKSNDTISKSHKSKSSNKTKKPAHKTEHLRKSKTNKISSKSPNKKKLLSPKDKNTNIISETKRINVLVNSDLYSKINSLFYPHLFVKSSHNFKFFSNFELHDKYLASVISHGLMIRKYS